jgi:signal transduction histidine kinase/DNA-binding response OmpR family regulator
MDILDALFKEVNNREEHLKELLELLRHHVPDGGFQIISSSGRFLSSGTELHLDNQIRETLIKEAKDKNELYHYEMTEGEMIHVIPIDELDALLVFSMPGHSNKQEMDNHGVTAVRLCVELFTLKRTFDEEQKLRTVQKNQMKRKTIALEEEYRGIMKDLIQSCEATESANIIKREFLANISHEMRTPLNGIIGMADLTLDTRLDEDQKELVNTISIEAKSLHSLINDVLDFSKIESGKFELEEILFDPRHMIDDLISSFAYRAEKKGLELVTFYSPGIPAGLIGDAGRLRQIITNLLSNALKFTLQGEIFARIEVIDEDKERVKLRFTIKDTGIGIAKEIQEKIFEPFIQADGSTTRKFGGTGLGTTISRQLVELMGGEIGLESEPGKGSRFWFSALFNKVEKQEALLSKEEFDLSQMKVMVVNAKHYNRFVMSEYLKSWGCIPLEANSGEMALTGLKEAVMDKECCDLVVTGIELSDMNGFDMAKEIRADKNLKDVPIIVLTSLGWRGDGKRCRDIGINGYLTKPIKQEDFYRVIVSIMGCSGGDRGSEASEVITKHTIAEDDARKASILLVEDHPTNQKVAIRYLSKAGYRVELAENGLQGIEAFKRKKYSLILMDMQMPMMDGYEATANIRAMESERANTGGKHGQHIPIIAMTAHAAKGDRERCLEAGTDDYITKPMTREDLLSLVRKWICHNAGQDDMPDKVCIKEKKQKEVLENVPMDLEMMLAQYNGDKQSLAELVSEFIEVTREQIKVIHQALSEGNVEAVSEESHSIKGSAALITAHDLSSVAYELQVLGDSGSLEGSEEVTKRLEKEFIRLDAYAKNL